MIQEHTLNFQFVKSMRIHPKKTLNFKSMKIHPLVTEIGIVYILGLENHLADCSLEHYHTISCISYACFTVLHIRMFFYTFHDLGLHLKSNLDRHNNLSPSLQCF